MTDRREHALDGIARAQMVPMLGREVVEGQQRLAILGQAGDGLVVLVARIWRGSVSIASSAVGAGLGRPNLAKVCLRCWAAPISASLFNTLAVLCTQQRWCRVAAKDLLQRLPEAERAVADGQFRRTVEPTGFQVDEELAPDSARSPGRPPGSRPAPSCPRVWRRSSRACTRLVGSIRACR